MPEHGRSDPPFWINDKDERGQPLDAEVLGAAERIWARVVVLTRSGLHDVSRSAEILEATAAAVSRALRRRSAEPAVRDIDAYLLYAFIRRLHKIAAKESRLESGHSTHMLAHFAARTGPQSSEVDAEIQLRELLSYMDFRTRGMFALRCEGYSWKQIAEQLDFKSGHSAEVQFNKVSRAARMRLMRAFSLGCPDSKGRE
jgi:hypothetical protein